MCRSTLRSNFEAVASCSMHLSILHLITSLKDVLRTTHLSDPPPSAVAGLRSAIRQLPPSGVPHLQFVVGSGYRREFGIYSIAATGLWTVSVSTRRSAGYFRGGMVKVGVWVRLG